MPTARSPSSPRRSRRSLAGSRKRPAHPPMASWSPSRRTHPQRSSPPTSIPSTPIGPWPGQSIAPVAAALSLLVDRYDIVLLPASPDGRDIAGTLSALTGPGGPGQRDRRQLVRRWPGRRDERVRWQAHHRECLHDRPGHHHGPPQQRDRREAGSPGDVRPLRARSGARSSRPSGSSIASTRRAPRSRSTTHGSSSRAAAASAGQRGSSSSGTWPRRSVGRSGRRAPPSIRAGSRTASRSARPARS